MCRTNNGFEIAEVDMKLRGPGDMEGTQQSGVIDLKIASISGDGKIMQTARHLALDLLTTDAELTLPQHAPTANYVQKLKNKYQSWGRIS